MSDFLGGGVAKTFKAILCDGDPGSPATIADIANEIVHANYTAGGEAFPNVTITTDGQNNGVISGDNLDIGAIVPGVTHIVYAFDTGTPATSPVLGDPEDLGGATDVQVITFPAGGVYTLTYNAS
jgi:hypothetical protein